MQKIDEIMSKSDFQPRFRERLPTEPIAPGVIQRMYRILTPAGTASSGGSSKGNMREQAGESCELRSSLKLADCRSIW